MINAESDELPDGWEETLDPPMFWIRYKGEVLVFHHDKGFITDEDANFMSIEDFRSRLNKLMGPPDPLTPSL